MSEGRFSYMSMRVCDFKFCLRLICYMSLTLLLTQGSAAQGSAVSLKCQLFIDEYAQGSSQLIVLNGYDTGRVFQTSLLEGMRATAVMAKVTRQNGSKEVERVLSVYGVSHGNMIRDAKSVDLLENIIKQEKLDSIKVIVPYKNIQATNLEMRCEVLR
jgi:hypothetical protein